MKLFDVTSERAAERAHRTAAAQQLRATLHQRISDAWQQRSDNAASLVSMHDDVTTSCACRPISTYLDIAPMQS